MLDSFYDLKVPEQLRDVATRHQRHVAELARNLCKLGLGDDVIEQTVDELIFAYRTELLQAIKSIGSVGNA